LITLVIMLALAFGILNTMLMALFERMHEIGMLLSIGMNRSRVFIMILMESVILTLTGALAGLILARLSIWYLGKTGINLKMFARGAQEIGWDKVMPMVQSSEYGLIIGIVMAVTIAASIYPAVKATHVNPIEAVKERG
jgi:ABC-type antimicrobial peptide transport system permease subunit